MPLERRVAPATGLEVPGSKKSPYRQTSEQMFS